MGEFTCLCCIIGLSQQINLFLNLYPCLVIDVVDHVRKEFILISDYKLNAIVLLWSQLGTAHNSPNNFHWGAGYFMTDPGNQIIKRFYIGDLFGLKDHRKSPNTTDKSLFSSRKNHCVKTHLDINIEVY